LLALLVLTAVLVLASFALAAVSVRRDDSFVLLLALIAMAAAALPACVYGALDG
jgi:hypothetical protein